MNPFKMLTHRCIDLIFKIGPLGFSILSSFLLITAVTLIEMILAIVLNKKLNDFNLLLTMLFLFFTVSALYFLSILIKKVEQSRHSLSRLLDKFEIMRLRDFFLYQQLNQEITRQKGIQQKLQQKFDLLFNSSPDLIYYCNEKSELLSCNQAVERLIGKSEKVLISLKPEDMYNCENEKKIKDTDQQVFKNNRALTDEQWFQYPDGREACFQIHKVPFYNQIGIKKGLMGFGRDITGYKNHQSDLKKTNREQNTFITTISHELLTPLSGIVGLSYILLDSELDADRTQYLKMIYINAVSLMNIFNDILDVNKIERAEINFNDQEVELTGFFLELEHIFALLAYSKGLEFQIEVSANLPQKVIIDATRLRQILWNLMSNAVKFSDQGKIIIQISYELEDRLIFSVKDSGIGISVEEQGKIFTLYYQIKNTENKTGNRGNGIGLAVSKQLAQKMGGDITVNSVKGKGSCFTLSVKAPVYSGTKSRLNPDKIHLPLLHVLLVEDVDVNIAVACAVFKKLTISFEVAKKGSEALAAFVPERFDLVFLDIHLPDMTGFDIARQIRSKYHQKSLPPLIAFTANILKNKQEYLKNGMDDVLTKPLSADNFIKIVKKYFPECAPFCPERVKNQSSNEVDSALNLTLLTQCVEMLGIPIMKKNATLFEKTLPHYLTRLENHAKSNNQQGVLEEAHKIESASGSIGLSYLQKCSREIQTTSQFEVVKECIDKLKLNWQNHIKILRDWIKKNGA